MRVEEGYHQPIVSRTFPTLFGIRPDAKCGLPPPETTTTMTTAILKDIKTSVRSSMAIDSSPQLSVWARIQGYMPMQSLSHVRGPILRRHIMRWPVGTAVALHACNYSITYILAKCISAQCCNSPRLNCMHRGTPTAAADCVSRSHGHPNFVEE